MHWWCVLLSRWCQMKTLYCKWRFLALTPEHILNGTLPFSLRLWPAAACGAVIPDWDWHRSTKIKICMEKFPFPGMACVCSTGICPLDERVITTPVDWYYKYSKQPTNPIITYCMLQWGRGCLHMGALLHGCIGLLDMGNKWRHQSLHINCIMDSYEQWWVAMSSGGIMLFSSPQAHPGARILKFRCSMWDGWVFVVDAWCYNTLALGGVASYVHGTGCSNGRPVPGRLRHKDACPEKPYDC